VKHIGQTVHSELLSHLPEDFCFFSFLPQHFICFVIFIQVFSCMNYLSL